jgi:hypothetical protein
MIDIKPHHFVDVVTSLGAETVSLEPHPYGHAVHTVTKQLLDDRDLLLRIELGADTICAPCVHNHDGLCEDTIDTSFRPEAPSSKRAWNLTIDQRWCARLGIAQGDVFPARALCERIRDRMGDITDIYREVPAHMTADRVANLERGIEAFLRDPHAH